MKFDQLSLNPEASDAYLAELLGYLR